MEPLKSQKELSVEEFWQRFFIKGMPLVFRNIHPPFLQASLLMNHVRSLLKKKAARLVGFSIWLDSDHIQPMISQPVWVSYCVKHASTNFLHSNCRIFSWLFFLIAKKYVNLK